MKKGKGFTLIELLVIVLIIVILAIIAIPAYQKYDAKNVNSGFAKVDKYLNSLPSANIAFNTRGSMEIDSTHTVNLILSLVKTIEELKKEIKEEGALEGDSIKVSSNMGARLSGQGFEILAITPEKQSISGSDNTEWKWDVSPRKDGVQKLHLTLSAFIDIEGKQTARAIRTFDREIIVNVSFNKRAYDFISNHWQWLLSTLLIPLIVYSWKCSKGKNE